MLLTYLMLTVALSLSAVAAFYSIVGLTAIFSAAVIPIIIMGSILEASKIVVTVWLHEYWRQCKLAMKMYLVPAVAILMLITSMGIFGFLSKAHSDQSLVSGDVMSRISIYDEKIKTAKDNIEAARKALRQMDEAVDQTMARSTSEEGASKASNLRRSQQRERGTLTKEIETNQKLIASLNEESAPIRAEVRKVEAEVGPIKYIAALIYGDNPDANLLERAVRWVIIILVAVFDPLAIFMLLAATESYKWEKTSRRKESQDEPIDNTIDDEVAGGNTVVVDDRLVQPIPATVEPVPDAPPADGPVLEPVVSSPEPIVEPTAEVIPNEEIEIIEEGETSAIKQAMHLWKLDNPSGTLKEQRRLFDAEVIDQLPWEAYLDDPRILHDVGFGKSLPKTADRGDQFVLIDQQPTVLFKYNGSEWIAVDINLSDNYSHNQAYIDYLINRISSGDYDPDLLTDSERGQIENKLRKSAT